MSQDVVQAPKLAELLTQLDTAARADSMFGYDIRKSLEHRAAERLRQMEKVLKDVGSILEDIENMTSDNGAKSLAEKGAELVRGSLE